jgi:hypothetical protein
MAEPTKGPWRAGYVDEEDRKERMVVRAERVDGQPYVAICPRPLVGSHEANAALIAAAPTMRDLLKEWLRLTDAVGGFRAAELMLNGLRSDDGERVERMTRAALTAAGVEVAG